MSATYEMREMPDIHKKGEQVIYHKMKIYRQVSTEELIKRIASGSTLHESDLKAAISAIGQEIANSLADGKSVKIDGIGTFSAKLGLNKGVERETLDEDKPHRNARSISVTGINLRVDNRLISTTNSLCELKRTSATGRISEPQYSREECLRRALTYLESHPYLTVSAYVELTGKKRSTATKELREFADDRTTGITANGLASHRVYVKQL